jgi:hypothetical protein
MTEIKKQHFVPAELIINGRIYKTYQDAFGERATILEEALRDAAESEEGKYKVIKKKIAAAASLVEGAQEHRNDIYIKIFERIERGRADQKISPPALGESLLLLFCPTNRADAILGDLAEQFETEVQKKGIKRATLLYWVRAIRSFGPLLVFKIRNTGIWLFVIEIGRRWIGS